MTVPVAGRMRAVVVRRFGGPEVLEPADVDVPHHGPGEILVRVAACGVCGHDLLARAGRLGGALPRILGHEISGAIVSVGADVASFGVGQRVVLNQRRHCGRCSACRTGHPNRCVRGAGFYGEDLPGGYAQYVVAEPANAVPLPEEVSDIAAAALPCGVVTALHALRRAGARYGDVVAIMGAGGGVGVHAVAIAASTGARVIAVTHRADKAPALREAGADEVVVTEGADTARVVREAAGGNVDVVVDCAGVAVGAGARILRHGGRLALLGNIDPRALDVPAGLLILKEIELIGSAHGTPDELATAVSMVAGGGLEPRIAATFPLEAAADAHRRLEARGTVGRVVLTV